ncbi:MAG: amidase domain-containing protein [Bacillota bacterium]
MLREIDYNRDAARLYAKKWAFLRNPEYMDFSKIGGDCTNFVSQCLFAGCNVMNYTPVYGWYYLSENNRAAAWTGVEFLYNFLIDNKAQGPYGKECSRYEIKTGDIIQLGDKQKGFYHSLIVCGFFNGEILVATHSIDVYNRPLSTYTYDFIRYIHIEGARVET